MTAVKNRSHYDRLQKRRAEMLVTLAYIRQERRTVDANKDRIKPTALKSRVALLCDLIDWYVSETARIDNALSRITRARSGTCRICHKPIAPGSLETPTELACCCEFRQTRKGVEESGKRAC